MKYLPAIAITILFLSACNNESQSGPEVTARVRENTYKSCMTIASGYPGISIQVGKTYCDCVADKTMATYSPQELAKIEALPESEGKEKFRPIFEQCANLIPAKTK